MYLVVGKLFIGAFLLAFLGCSSTPVPASKPEPERKWVPYRIAGYTIRGGPAFYLILETYETACGKSQHPERCRVTWENIPKNPPPMSQDEIQYLEDYGDGPQPTRMTKRVYCVITRDEAEDQSSCDARWKDFWKEQKSKEA